MARFRLLCKAARCGFYGDRMHYPATGPDSDHKRAGFAFALLADGLRYDSEGRMEVDKDLRPILPSWVIPQEEVKPIDKSIPHVVVTPKKLRLGRRNLPKEVREAAPVAWPKNVQKKSGEMDENREVKIKKAGTQVAEEDED